MVKYIFLDVLFLLICISIMLGCVVFTFQVEASSSGIYLEADEDGVQLFFFFFF